MFVFVCVYRLMERDRLRETEKERKNPFFLGLNDSVCDAAQGFAEIDLDNSWCCM